MTKEEGFALVQKWKESGLSQQEYSKVHGSPLHTLRYYSRMVNPKVKNHDSPTCQKQFIEVTPKQTSGHHHIIIKFPSGIEVHLDSCSNLASVLEGIKQL